MTENEFLKNLDDAINWIDVRRNQPLILSDLRADTAIKALNEYKQYRAIGTVEECREARERQMEKKPIKDEYNHDCCPNCGWIVYKDEWGGRYLPHCENCGQAIDWSDTP